MTVLRHRIAAVGLSEHRAGRGAARGQGGGDHREPAVAPVSPSTVPPASPSPVVPVRAMSAGGRHRTEAGSPSWILAHVARSPSASAYVAWVSLRSLALLGEAVAHGQRAALLAVCEGTTPVLRGLFSEYEAGFWAQVFLYDEYCVRRARLAPGALVLDIGANVGFFSWRAFACQPRATVVAVEPEPANLAVLHQVFERLAIAGEVVEAACADRDGTATLHLRTSVTHSLDPDHHPELDAGTSLPVAVTRLDSWMAARGWAHRPVDLLKVDVEGSEVEVLVGASATLRRTRRVVLEYDGAERRRACRLLLADAGLACRQRAYFGPAGGDSGLLFAER